MGLMLTKNLYRPDEVAVMLKISKRTVYRMVRRGDLDKDPHRDPARITVESLMDFIWWHSPGGTETLKEAPGGNQKRNGETATAGG